MSAALSHHELRIVAELQRTGLSLPVATLAVVMAIREHARPAPELTDIVRQYQHLENRATAEEAIGELRRLGWLVESESYGLMLVHQAPDLVDKLADRLRQPELSVALRELRSTFERNVSVIGPMKDKEVYQTFLEILRGAQSEICLPMLATSPNMVVVQILQERARQGVRIRILLGSPKLVAKLRGETMTRVALDAIHGWTQNASGISNIRLRISNSAEDMEIATCMSVDSRLLRFDIYDSLTQRSLQGIMIQVESPTGMELNLIKLFRRRFEESWTSAKPITTVCSVVVRLKGMAVVVLRVVCCPHVFVTKVSVGKHLWLCRRNFSVFGNCFLVEKR
jgi:predicted transcriptional regulator